jgi:hypothetical protein
MLKTVLWCGFLFISHDDMSQGVNLGPKCVSLVKAKDVLGHVGQRRGDQVGQNFCNLGYFLKARAFLEGKYGLL